MTNETVDSIACVNAARKLIFQTSSFQILDFAKSWIDPVNETHWIIKKQNIQDFILLVDHIYTSTKTFYSKFSKKTIIPKIEEFVLTHAKKDIDCNKVEFETFVKSFECIDRQFFTITAPISGIRLDQEVPNFEISVFKFGKSSGLDLTISNQEEIYIQTKVSDFYDAELAILKSQNAFDDFARLIHFMGSRGDGSIAIKTGLPSYPVMSHEKMYVQTTSYQIELNGNKMPGASINNRLCDRIPINNDFFARNENFSKLWEFYIKHHNNTHQTDIEKRILNSALAVGESMCSSNHKNSIMYTCIALEILFSFDEGSIFQKSIGDRLAETFVFLVAKNKEARIATDRLVKEVYRMRSAIVHGGDKALNNKNLSINNLLRAAISELLNNEKYRDLKKIDDLYKMVKDAHYSY